MRVLYLFAGAARKSDIESFLEELCASEHVDLRFLPVDILRGGPDNDLLPEHQRTLFIDRITQGNFDVVIVSPPCDSFSRLQWGNRNGPCPVRSHQWPWGFPWLRAKDRQRCEMGNIWVIFTCQVLEAIAKVTLAGLYPVLALLEHPEDLGATQNGVPASIWQLPQVRRLVDELGMLTCVCHQCAYGVDYPKPTRWLGNFISLNTLGVSGWPSFDACQCYTGPLQRCGHRHRTSLVRKSYHDQFPSQALHTAAYPPRLCEAIAAALFTDWQTGNGLPVALLRQGGGTGPPDNIEPETVTKVAPSTTTTTATCDGMPETGAMVLPTRDRLPADGRLLEDDVYIGRGDDLRGLAPSRWSNPYRVKELGKAAAISLFKLRLKRDARLTARIPGLSGKRLLCHCERSHPCHADAIIEVFKELRDGDANLAPRRPTSCRPGGEDRLEPGDSTSEEDVFGAPKPRRNTGWLGRGAMISVAQGSRLRGLQDGGGLCSPGRWLPGRRLLPRKAAAVRSILYDMVRRIEEEGKATALELLCRISSGKIQANPVEHWATETSRSLESLLQKDGFVRAHRASLPGEVIDFQLFRGLLEHLGDPDTSIMDHCLVGVRVGVGARLPRTPAVWDRKTRWRKLDDDGEDPYWHKDNYRSATLNADRLRGDFEEQLKENMFVRMELDQAKRIYGERLHVAALALIEQGEDSWRIVHDATHGVKINNRLRVRDQHTGPMACDLAKVMSIEAAHGKLFALVFDVSKAHRRVPVSPGDWGYQACAIEDPQDIWLNTVGTFGVGSISYWWSRVGACIVRLLYYVLGDADSALRWCLLFADDLKLLARGPRLARDLLAALLLLLALKIPLKWKKFSGGWQVQWIGFWFDYTRFELGLSESRARWLSGWCDALCDAGMALIRNFKEGLGRLGFATVALTSDRPFLGPLYAWAAVHPEGACVALPLMVKIILKWLARRLRERRSFPVLLHTDSEPIELFRADAAADDDKVAVGGWSLVDGGEPAHARWFAVELDRTSAPWAFARGEPFRTIASLELYSTLLSIMAFAPEKSAPRSSSLRLTLTGTTDNKGNSSAVARLMTSKYPLCVILMELTVQLERRGLELQLGWAPRDQNSEADALTKGDFHDFDASRRIHIDPRSLQFEVMDELLRTGEDLYEQIKEVKLAPRRRAPELQAQPPRKRRLKERDPW